MTNRENTQLLLAQTIGELGENLPELIDMYRNGDIKFSEMIRMFHESEENILVNFENV